MQGSDHRCPGEELTEKDREFLRAYAPQAVHRVHRVLTEQELMAQEAEENVHHIPYLNFSLN